MDTPLQPAASCSSCWFWFVPRACGTQLASVGFLFVLFFLMVTVEKVQKWFRDYCVPSLFGGWVPPHLTHCCETWSRRGPFIDDVMKAKWLSSAAADDLCAPLSVAYSAVYFNHWKCASPDGDVQAGWTCPSWWLWTLDITAHLQRYFQ